MTPAMLATAFAALAEAPDGVRRLRELVLQLAVRGRLAPQDPADEPAAVLLGRIAAEKARLVREGRIRREPPLPPVSPDEVPFGVPAGWVWCRLGGLLTDIQAGWSPAALARPKEGEEWGVLKVSACSWGRFLPGENKALAPGATPRTDLEVRAGDFLISRANTSELVARSVVVAECPSRLLLSDKTLRLVTGSGLSAAYLNLANHSSAARAHYERQASGTSASMKNVSQEAIREAPIPLPPLAEQHRIVAQVDEWMGLLDRFEAARATREATRRAARDAALAALGAADTPAEVARAWERIAAHMDDLFCTPGDVAPLRQTILQLAVRGRLVPQDPADEPAAALLGRIAAAAVAAVKSRVAVDYESDPPFDGPSHWAWVYLGDAMGLVNGRAFKPSEWSDAGLPIVRIQNLNDPTAPYNHCDFDVDEKVHIGNGDLLLSWSGTPGTSFGAFIWQGGRAVLNQHIFRCEARGEAFATPFLRLAINSRLGEMIDRAHGGVGLRHVTRGKLAGLYLPLPPLAEQHRIVAKVDELLALVAALEARLRAAEAAATAFAGAAVHRLAG